METYNTDKVDNDKTTQISATNWFQRQHKSATSYKGKNVKMNSKFVGLQIIDNPKTTSNITYRRVCQDMVMISQFCRQSNKIQLIDLVGTMRISRMTTKANSNLTKK